MVQWVSLKEILEKPEEYGNIYDIKVAYTPDCKEITLKRDTTGYCESGYGFYYEEQPFKTEMDHTWHLITQDRTEKCVKRWRETDRRGRRKIRELRYPDRHFTNVYLLSGEVTKSALTLQGAIGLKEGGKAQEAVTGIYESQELHTMAMVWTEEAVKLLESVPETLKCVEDPYAPDCRPEYMRGYWTTIGNKRWSNMPERFISTGFKVLGYDGIFKSCERGEIWTFSPFTSNRVAEKESFPIRPLLRILKSPDKIFLDVRDIENKNFVKIRTTDSV